MKRPKILIITTGGTIDAEGYKGPAPERVTPLEHSIIPATVHMLGHGADCGFYELCRKDSNDVDVDDLQHLAQVINDPHSEYDYILITHGTDTMPRNARYLAELLGKTDKTVVFTGAMEPIANGEHSDGIENLRMFLETYRDIPAGVHVIMGETLLPIAGLRKDFKEKRFYITDEPDNNERLPPLGRSR
ncbi:MAG: hypothetical protein EB060_09805 [Proteobacteria bacterium]|nr:hypothetical protein [Pseudomonadota bacterium]